MQHRNRLNLFIISTLCLLGSLQADPYEKADAALAALSPEVSPSQTGEARLYALFDAIWAFRLESNPNYASYVGVTDFNDRWTDNSLPTVEKRQEQTRKFLRALESIDPSSLNDRARLDWRLVVEDHRERVEGYRFPSELMPINQLDGPQRWVSSALDRMPRASSRDYADILSRLASADQVILANIPLLQKGLSMGITPPRVTLRNLPGQFDSLVLEDATRTPLWRPFKEMPANMSAEEAGRIQARAAELISGPVREAFLELKAYLENDYIPNCRESISSTSLPDGEAWYAYRVRETTTTSLSPGEIHDIGLAEVERIQKEIMEIAREAGFEGDFQELRTFMHTDPRFFYDREEDLVNGFRIICKKADPELVKLFGILPRLPYGIEPTPANIAPSAPGGRYLAGSLKSGRPGYFEANTYDLNSRPKWIMEALALHETVPGHHLQIAIAREIDSLHPVRRYQRYTAYSEGWALYSEQLGYRMGLYRDPWSQVGQKASEIFRAVRLVVDTGLHAKGWSRDQAIGFFREHSLALEHETVVEVDRYIVWPSQALAYKIGQLEISRLRRMAEEKLGDRFDIRAFHDLVLGSGAMPLEVLEDRVTDWMEAI